MTPLPGPNDEQIRNWNDLAGPRWAAESDALDAQLKDLGLAAMAALGDLAGARVLDIGCGCGATSLELADQVGAGGSVTGVDVSTVMLARARSRAGARPNVGFLETDAQTTDLGAGVFDAAFSRFGVMFFRDPTEAFGRVREALRADGRLAFVCWQAMERNPWMHLPLQAVLPLVLKLPTPVPPDAPGPFAFADPDRVRGILKGAGFTDVRVVAHDTAIRLGGRTDLDAAVEDALRMGPTAVALREAPADVGPAAREAVRRVLAPFLGASGVSMPCATWIATARRASAG